MATDKEKQLSFEEAAGRIDEIVTSLERGDAPLEKSLEMFEEGAKLIKICSKMLDEAEQKVKGLQKDGQEPVIKETLFDDE